VLRLVEPAAAPPPPAALATLRWTLAPPLPDDLPSEARARTLPLFPDPEAARRDRGDTRFALVFYEGGGTATLTARGPAVTLAIE
jgi:hypothetical protein